MDILCVVGHEKNAKLGIGRSSQGIEGYGGDPLWRCRPTLGCSANEEELAMYAGVLPVHH